MDTVRKILLIGPYPPPKGGVSIHIERLAALLEEDGVDVCIIDESPIFKQAIFNMRSLNVFRYVKSFIGADVIHIHSSVDALRIANILTALVLKKRVVVTLHSWRQKRTIVRRIHNFLFRWTNTILCVNSEISRSIHATNKIVRPAFIPPNMDLENELSREIQTWLDEQKRRGRTLLASNAYQLNRYKSEDIYGADICIEAARNLIDVEKLNLSFVFAVASKGANNNAFEVYRNTIKDYGLEDRFLLVHKPDLSFVKLIERADIIIRATNTDGDALSVREALHLKRPVIASDVVERPGGVVLFKNRDVHDLTETIKKLINDQLTHCGYTPPCNNDDSASFYKHIYGLDVQ